MVLGATPGKKLHLSKADKIEGGNTIMRPNKIKQLILGVIAAAVLIPGVLTSTAEAQSRQFRRPRPVIVYRHYNPFWYRRYDPFWNPYWGPTTYTYVDPIAYQKEQGYNEG